MAKFIEGNTYSKGRPKGALGKRTKQAKDFIKSILDENENQIREDIKTLKPYERVKVYLEFMQYSKPKLRAIEVIEDTSNEDDEFINRLLDIPEENYESL